MLKNPKHVNTNYIQTVKRDVGGVKLLWTAIIGRNHFNVNRY